MKLWIGNDPGTVAIRLFTFRLLSSYTCDSFKNDFCIKYSTMQQRKVQNTCTLWY